MCLKVFDRESVFEKEFVSQDRERESESMVRWKQNVYVVGVLRECLYEKENVHVFVIEC